MKGKLLFVAGAAVGYVFGARAGRKRYEQIKHAAQTVWETDGVQTQVHQLQDFAAARVGDVPGALAQCAKKAFSAVAGRTKNASEKTTNPTTAAAAAEAAAGKTPPAEA
jgi:hypothetical protein